MSQFNMSCPIKYFEDNLIFNNSKKECWAAFKMEGFNYDFRSSRGKITILNALSRFLANIGQKAKILIVPVSQDIDKHYERIINGMSKKNILYEHAKAHAQQTSAYLKANIMSTGNANDYRVYIITKLSLKDDIIREIKEAIDYFIKEPVQTVLEYFSIENKEITKREINGFVKLSNEYMKRQSRRISIKECNSYETQWLIRRVFYRGLGEFRLIGDEENMWTPFAEKVIKNGEQAIRPDHRQILTLSDGIIDIEEGRRLKVIHPDGRESHQAFLAISYIPDIEFPGAEWLLALQDYPVQTEVCINISTIEHKNSLRNIDKKKKEIKDQIEHINKSEEEVPDELVDGMEYANGLEAELKASKSPMTHVSVFFCISADNKEELDSKVTFIKELYEDSNFMIERPMSDQLKLFMEFFPGSDDYVTDYVQKIPPRTLAGGMIGATRLLGDNIGPYIGTTGILNKNVFLDVSRACKLNRSASGAFFGTLGGGKSFSANLLFYLAVLYGAYGLVLDPKGERSNWIQDLPEFKNEINIITLSAEQQDKGKLDPFLIYKDNLEEASSLAISILSELFNFNSKDSEYLAILEALSWVKQQEKPCMMLLADRLLKFPEDDELCKIARFVGRKIMHLRNMAMAGLLFGDGTEEGLDFNKRINILQIQNLNMPDPSKPKEEYNQDELLSTVLMIPIASFARKFIHRDRSYFKITLFDEAWALRATTSGRQMMNSLIREGRALYAGCFFISQSTKDASDEGIKTNISYKFCFKATDIDEIKSILSFLDLEVTEENISTVRNLENGQCLFQDLDGRVGLLKFDAVFEHLIERAFNTNPEKDGEKGGKTA